MSKTKIVGIVLAVLAIGAVVVWWIMSDNAKDKKVQQEIDAVVKCIKFNPPRLCTVKLSRRVFPGQPSYSLHKLTESLGLPDFNHHRALDDTMAAAEILKLALAKVGEEGVLKYVVNQKKNK